MLIGVYKIIYSKLAINHISKLRSANLAKKAKKLIDVLKINPYQTPPPYEKLVCSEKYSRRINIKHRLVYEIDDNNKTIYILSAWTHYEFLRK